MDAVDILLADTPQQDGPVSRATDFLSHNLRRNMDTVCSSIGTLGASALGLLTLATGAEADDSTVECPVGHDWHSLPAAERDLYLCDDSLSESPSTLANVRRAIRDRFCDAEFIFPDTGAEATAGTVSLADLRAAGKFVEKDGEVFLKTRVCYGSDCPTLTLRTAALDDNTSDAWTGFFTVAAVVLGVIGAGIGKSVWDRVSGNAARRAALSEKEKQEELVALMARVAAKRAAAAKEKEERRRKEKAEAERQEALQQAMAASKAEKEAYAAALQGTPTQVQQRILESYLSRQSGQKQAQVIKTLFAATRLREMHAQKAAQQAAAQQAAAQQAAARTRQLSTTSTDEETPTTVEETPTTSTSAADLPASKTESLAAAFVSP